MTATVTSQFEIDAEDVEYIRHGDKPLLAHVYKPRGQGPFPLMLELHGGAWCRFDRFRDKIINEALAKRGVVVVALEFRMPPDGVYPTSLADINFATRWFKSRAKELGSRPDMVGIMGSSSGGHLAMLAAMRPHDPRYAALPLSGNAGVDASVRCAVLYWPVIDPLGRYEYAKKLKAGGQPYPDVVDRALPDHDRYWQTEAAMDEGSPVRALERGERTELPPVLYIQGTRDVSHPRPYLDRFIAAYRKVGGRVDLQLYEGEGAGFITRNPHSPAVAQALDKIIEFVHREIHA